MPGKLGFYLGLTGYRLEGSDNLFVGIATHYCSSAEISKIEQELLASNNPREVLKPYEKPHLGLKFSLEPLLEKINYIFSAPTIEEIVLRLEKDGTAWSKGTIETLMKLPPLSLKITLKQLQLGGHLTIQECLQMEYRLALRRLADHDFSEGVRALLIDKDKSPKWNPPTLETVSQKMVDDYFVPFESHQELNPRSGPKLFL